MNARQVNSISIRNYLSSIGINPVRSNKRSSLYLAPYRSETTPSLKVSHDQNLWVDYGNDNKGGTLIDLVLLLNPTYNVSDAIRAIGNIAQSFLSFHQQKSHNNSKHEIRIMSHEGRNAKHELPNSKFVLRKTENEIANTGADNQGNLKSFMSTHNTGTRKQQYLTRVTGAIYIYRLQDLGNNPAITAYLNQRGIQVATALPFCKETYYTIAKKKYFGLGNQNNKGWSIRNKYWKGCTGQGYSYYTYGSQELNVFEGIFDLLSYLELNLKSEFRADFLALNSLVNLKKSISILETYKEVNLFLDHDLAGRNATKLIMDLLPDCMDASSFYCSFKDLNDYHLTKVKGKMVKEEEQFENQ